jgi:quercetin dioxygenase-like cupin family protein
LPHGGDLDANLVVLPPGGEIGEHRNDEVDVLVVVLAGAGAVSIDGTAQPLSPHVAVLLPRGSVRRISADGDGLRYLTVHRARPGLSIGGPRRRPG